MHLRPDLWLEIQFFTDIPGLESRKEEFVRSTALALDFTRSTMRNQCRKQVQ